MTVVVETGAGVRNANAYADVAYVTAYLTALNRQTDWSAASTAVKEAAIIAATQYIENVHGPRVRGVRRFSFDALSAEASVVFSGVPTELDTITIGQITYTFTATPSEIYDVEIGVDADTSAANLADAVNNTSADCVAEADVTTVTLTAPAGYGGNFTVLTEDADNVAVTAFSGGADGGSQPLSFPRSSLVDASGRLVSGVPRKVRDAMAEYADRARVAALAPDPTVNATGQVVKRTMNKVGPIETETEFVDSGALLALIKPYPAADMLMSEFLSGSAASGTAFR